MSTPHLPPASPASLSGTEASDRPRAVVSPAKTGVSADSIAQPRLSVVIPTFNNLPVLRECLESWERHADRAPVELIVIDDGCSDGTTEHLAAVAATPFGRRYLRVIREENVHELMCTNRGLAEARAPLVMSWHDDMFLRCGWFVPELLATFDAYGDIGLLALSRGLTMSPSAALPETWEETIDWGRVQSTIGPAPLNWLRLFEVDGVMRPWVVRTACVDAVGALDEAYRPTEWDEVDLCYRIRQAGWRIATHGFERDGAYVHLLNTTLGRTPSETRMALGLRNARMFYETWEPTIHEEHARTRKTWRRRLTLAGAAGTARAMARTALGRPSA